MLFGGDVPWISNNTMLIVPYCVGYLVSDSFLSEI